VARRRKTVSQTSRRVLRNLSSEDRSPKWIDVSYRLFVLSGCKYYRPAHKCREFWTNHMDSKVRKEKWTPEEDLLLFSSVAESGQKWSIISKLFGRTRTDNMVKNRYNCVMREYKKKANKRNPNKNL